MQSQAIPQILYDLYLDFGNDLVPLNHGLALSSGSTRSQQRVLRRLLTAINGYIWHVQYGAGLPGFVGQALSQDNYNQIQSLILSNMFLEDSVSQTPSPIITFQPLETGLYVQVQYTENPTQNPIIINFTVGV